MTTPAIQPETKSVRRGFGLLPCPLCRETGLIRVSLMACIDPVERDDCTEEFHCAECDGDFSVEEVREFIDLWLPVLTWLDTAPVIDD